MSQSLSKMTDLIVNVQQKKTTAEKKGTKNSVSIGGEQLASELAGQMGTLKNSQKDIKMDTFKELFDKKIVTSPKTSNTILQNIEKTALKEVANNLESKSCSVILKNLATPINKENLALITGSKKQTIANKTNTNLTAAYDTPTEKLQKTISKTFENLSNLVEKPIIAGNTQNNLQALANTIKNTDNKQPTSLKQTITKSASSDGIVMSKNTAEEAKFANEFIPLGKIKSLNQPSFEGLKSLTQQEILVSNTPEKGFAEQFAGNFHQGTELNLNIQATNRGLGVSFNQTNFEQFPSASEQLTESLKANFAADNKQMTVNLNPPELGRLMISFSEENGILTGKIQAERTSTGADIERNMPEIIKTLQDAGITVRRVDVSVQNENNNNNYNFNDASNGRKTREEAFYSGSDNTNGSLAKEKTFLENNENSITEDFVNLYL